MEKKKTPLWFEEPTEKLRNVQEDMLRNMQEMMSMPMRIGPMPLKFPELKSRIMPIKLADADRELLLMAELPGFSKEEIKLRVTPNSVDISAEKKRLSMDKGENFSKQQKIYGSTRRIFPLPIEISTEGVRAKFDNGLLKITLPKRELRKKEEKEVKVK
jgi:HSP20 family protein